MQQINRHPWMRRALSSLGCIAAVAATTVFGQDQAAVDRANPRGIEEILWGIRYPTETPFGLFGRFAHLRLTADVAR